MGIPDHLTCLLRNLYVGQESTVRILYGTIDWFKIEKGVGQDCILSPCLFNLYAEHIIRNVGLDDLQAEIKIGGGNINNFRYVDDSTLMAESEEELRSLLMRMKEENEISVLKLNINKIRSWHLTLLLHGKERGKNVEVVIGFLFMGSKITVNDDCSHKIRRHLLLGRKAMRKPRLCVE